MYSEPVQTSPEPHRGRFGAFYPIPPPGGHGVKVLYHGAKGPLVVKGLKCWCKALVTPETVHMASWLRPALYLSYLSGALCKLFTESKLRRLIDAKAISVQ